MGFLKFLKRAKKEEEFGDFDLPPAPPPLEDFEKDINLEFPELEEKISAPPEEFKFDFPEENAPEIGKEEMPEFPEIEEEPLPPETALPTEPAPPAPPSQITMPQPVAEQEKPMQEEPELELPSEFQKEARAVHEKARHRPTGKTIYVRIDKFKATLGNINIIRSDLRKSEEALIKLENIKSSKDKSFDKVRALLDDLQKKLIFIDKTLFEGD